MQLKCIPLSTDASMQKIRMVGGRWKILMGNEAE